MAGAGTLDSTPTRSRHDSGGTTMETHMTRFRNGLFGNALLCVLPAVFAAAAQAETIEDVQKAIADKAAACKSISYKTHSDIDTTNGDMKYVAVSDMTFEAMRKGEKWLYRSEGKTKSTTTMSGQETKQDITSLMVQDGQFYWILTDMGTQKTCMKNVPNNDFSVIIDKTMWEEMNKTFAFKLVGDESQDGKACWAVESTPKDATKTGNLGKTMTWYDKSTGVAIKSIAKDDKGKVMSTSVTTDVKIDASIPEDRFTFKAPAGVEVMDRTQQQGNTEAGDKPADEPKKDEPKKDEPKKEEPKKDEPKKPKLPKFPR